MNMINGTCKNCGYWSGLHHYQTHQCPANGNEDNTYIDTTYEYDGDADRIAELEAALKTAVRYLENPEVKAIPFALPVESVVEHIQKLLKG